MQNDDLAIAGVAEAEYDRAHDRKVLDEKAYEAHDGVARKMSADEYSAEEEEIHPDSPTEEEKATLERVPDKLEINAYLMCVALEAVEGGGARFGVPSRRSISGSC